jgi:hypothetical protein
LQIKNNYQPNTLYHEKNLILIDLYLGHEMGDHFYATSKTGVIIAGDVKIDNTQKSLIIGDSRYTVYFSECYSFKT